MSVSTIWQQFIEGDNQVLGELYRPMFRKLFFVAYKYTHNEETSFDLVQDLFTNLLHSSVNERKEKWQEIQNIEGFLVTLIKCKSLDWLKISKNREKILNKQQKIIESDYLNEIDDNHIKLDKIIEYLTEKEQIILKLYLAGYKNDEIAQLQNQSEKSIRNRLSESRNKLKLLWKRSYIFILILSWIN